MRNVDIQKHIPISKSTLSQYVNGVLEATDEFIKKFEKVYELKVKDYEGWSAPLPTNWKSIQQIRNEIVHGIKMSGAKPDWETKYKALAVQYVELLHNVLNPTNSRVLQERVEAIHNELKGLSVGDTSSEESGKPIVFDYPKKEQTGTKPGKGK